MNLMNRWFSRLAKLVARPHQASRLAGTPAVPVEESITPNFLICLETGTRQILLRRHLRERLHMTPEEYRSKWGLPKDYPMAAGTYVQCRDKIVNMHLSKQS
ncbi:MAG: MucR family transcriptional regulator [Paracoccaceae bacterium]|jgi:predicted transcriptional regulator